jgi:hypothetical protein
VGIREGVYTDYGYWWLDSSGGFLLTWKQPEPGVLRSFSVNASSVFNNTYNLIWAPFYSYRNRANYYAYRGTLQRMLAANGTTVSPPHAAARKLIVHEQRHDSAYRSHDAVR